MSIHQLTLGAMLANMAQNYIGVPFHHQGRNIAGLDCIGLVIASAEAMELRIDGKPLRAYDRTDYGREPSPPYLDEQLDACFDRVQEGEHYREGDILLFNIIQAPQHVGIITDISNRDPRFVHAFSSFGSVKHQVLKGRWEYRLCRAYRIPEHATSGLI